MKNIILTVLFTVISAIVLAVNIEGTVVDSGGSVLPGVSVYWEGTTVGTTTDSEGRFSITNKVATNVLVFSYIGYESKKITIESRKHLNIQMVSEGHSLSEVVVAERAPGTHLSRIEPIMTIQITDAELCKAACCNLGESFVTNPSVDVSYSDATTGAKQIRLLGLSGLYVQMLTENMPAFRGLASVYGLEYIPGPWMSSIQVSKGTASVINGYEAIAGQINVEYKKPDVSEKLFVNAFSSSAGRMELNVNSSVHINKKLSTMILGHIKNDNMLVDENHDEFLDVPMVRQYNIINRWMYKTDKYIAQYGVKAINETRKSGQKSFYTNDTSAYGINVKTERYEFFTKQGFIFNNATGKSLGVQISGSYHNQESFYGKNIYNGLQNNGYVNVIYQNETEGIKKHQYSIGSSIMYDEFTEKLDTVNMSRTEIVPGIFGQVTYNISPDFTILAGIRTDYHNEYGLFVTPRLHTKYNVTNNIHLRGSVGMGYRSANIIAENSYLLASSRQIQIADNLDLERALNTGLNATFYFYPWGKELVFSNDYYYTKFFTQVVADVDTDPSMVSFYNLNGNSFSGSYQSQLSAEIVKGLDITTAIRYTDVKATYNGILRDKPLTSKYKGLFTVSYQTPLKKWQVDFTSQFNGSGRMPQVKNNLWTSTYAPYTILNAQVTKYFRKWSVYIGGENLTNFKMDNPIVDAANPWGNNFDASMVWGPVHGRMFYAGVRFAIERE